jgi:hypothetical protein
VYVSVNALWDAAVMANRGIWLKIVEIMRNHHRP